MSSSRDKEAAVFLREDESRLVHQMVRDFSTYDRFDLSLSKQINLISLYLKVWLAADVAVHFFTNPNIRQVDFLLIENAFQCPIGCYQSRRIEISDLPQEITCVVSQQLSQFAQEIFTDVEQLLFVPFSQHGYPFGNFLLGFRNGGPSEYLCAKIKGSLNVLQNCLKDLLYNHYQITSDTYLPSFRTPRTVEAAILFCDIRNSTRMIEVARMANERYTDVVVSLIQSVLEYASLLISVPNVGRIDKFLGDGFLATFGEHLTVEPAQRARAACTMGLLAARAIVSLPAITATSF